MGVRTKAELKEYFEKGDRPTEAQYIDLIDTLISAADDQAVSGAWSFDHLKKGMGILNAAEHSDGSSTGGLAEAITALGGSDGVVYLPPGSYPIDADYTIPATADVIFAKGASCAVATTKTLTLNKEPQAGLYQIFSLAGTGKVSFANEVTVQTEWWGTGTNALGGAFASLSKGGTVEISNDITQSTAITVDTSAYVSVWNGICLRGTRPGIKITSTLTATHLLNISGINFVNRFLRVRLENVVLYGPGTPSGDGIHIDGSSGWVELSMENVLIWYFLGGFGLWAKEIYNGGGRDVEINQCNIGLKLISNANANHWFNLKVQWNKTYGCILEDIVAFGWFGGLIQSNEEHGLYITGSHNLLFDDVYWENNNSSETAGKYAVWINATDGHSNSRITFDTCRWVDAAVLQSQIAMGGVAGFINLGIHFNNCHHAGNDGNQVLIDTAYNADIRFLGGFDPARISNVSNCSIFMHVDLGTGLLDFPFFLGNKRWTYGTAAPGSGTWAQGDICWNTAPAAGGAPGWVCTTGGTPGTWKAMANLAA